MHNTTVRTLAIILSNANGFGDGPRTAGPIVMYTTRGFLSTLNGNNNFGVVSGILRRIQNINAWRGEIKTVAGNNQEVKSEVHYQSNTQETKLQFKRARVEGISDLAGLARPRSWR